MELNRSSESLLKPVSIIKGQMEHPLLLPFAGGTACVFSTAAPGLDTINEDTLAIIPFGESSGLLVVADGVGGSRAGAIASAIAVETLIQFVYEVRPTQGSLRSAILDAIEAANQEIQELGLGAATTLAVIEIQKNTIRPFHIGDSLILSVGQRGKIKLNPVEHSPTGYAIRAGLLNHHQALTHEDRHIVSNIVGDAAMHIEMGAVVDISSRDTVLVASDGLSDNLHQDEIIEIIRKGSLEEVAQHLALLARERMLRKTTSILSKPDDLSFIIFRTNE